MFQARTQAQIDSLRAGLTRVGGLSDNIFKFGPFGIGLDGALAWVPGVGPLYSAAAGVLILVLGWRARAPVTVMTQAVTILFARTAVSAAGDVVLPVFVPTEVLVDFFRGHKWASDMLVKSIDNTLYVEGRRHPSNPAFVETRARIRAGEERRRVVFLG